MAISIKKFIKNFVGGSDKNVFTSFLEEMNVKYTSYYSNKFFNEHPHKYNLYGLSKMLTDYGIFNRGFSIDDKENEISNLKTPFIAHIGNEFVSVNDLNGDNVHYQWHGKNIRIKINEFLKIWSGIVLIAESSEKAIEPDYKEHKWQEVFTQIQQTLLFVILVMVFAVFIYTNRSFTNLGHLILLIINIAGVYIGYLLLLKQVHIHSDYADKICSLFKQGIVIIF